MKIKLSKSQWEQAGEMAGWMKKAATEVNSICQNCGSSKLIKKDKSHIVCDNCKSEFELKFQIAK